MQRKKIYILYLIFLLSTFLQAQTFECTIEQSLNPTLDSLYVSFYIQKTSGADFIMGYADFRAYVKKTAVDITNAPTVVAGGIWHNNANYSPMATARNIPNSWVSLQISGITPNGYVTSTKQFIGTIAVPIINTVDSSGVNWFDSEVYDESYNLISGESYINPPMFWLGYIQLISPTNGTIYTSNASIDLEWISNYPNNYLYCDNGIANGLNTTSPFSTGELDWGTTYSWYIEYDTLGGLAQTPIWQFEVEDAITVTYPNGGEVLNKNVSYTITWDDNLSENVKIDLYKGGVFDSEIISSTPSNGSYVWTIPSGLTTGTDYRIRISSSIDNLLYDESDGDFTIRDAITVNYPNGGEVLNKNVLYTITWDDNLSENVRIELYKGGVFNSTIINSTPSNGSYDWTIPIGLTTGTDYRIRITSTTNGTLYDESNADFSIRDAIIITYPNGGEILNKNTSYKITWNDNLSENVKIDLYKGGVFDSEIVNSTTSNGSYDWTIPSGVVTGTDYRIRITSTTNGLLYDESNANFTIRDAIIVTYPNGGEVLNKNASYTITWDDNLSENVKIDLYKGGV
ncbi:MAG: hypothetical protein JW866_06420, partial [Ignavibacteriales bacterium]|nr:hypothetical protein [Ignavibacteriales bacterium]